MTTPIVRPEATALFELDVSTRLDISEGQVTLDDGWSPYVQASFEVPLTTVELTEQIDPKQTQRVVVDASDGPTYYEDPENPGFLVFRS